MHTPPSSMKPVSQEQLENLRRRLARLYGDDCAGDLLERLHFLVGRYGVQFDVADFRTQWDEKDVLLDHLRGQHPSTGGGPFANLE